MRGHGRYDGEHLDHTTDPLDYSRGIIVEQADKIARYAAMVAELIDLRNDDAAAAMEETLVSNVRAMRVTFKALAAGRRDEPHAAAGRFFRGVDGSAPTPQADDDTDFQRPAEAAE